MRSARFVNAIRRVPTTKPICTAMVSHAIRPGSNNFSVSTAGAIAFVLNQTESASIVARETSDSIRILPLA
jgi:hypothetical protein